MKSINRVLILPMDEHISGRERYASIMEEYEKIERSCKRSVCEAPVGVSLASGRKHVYLKSLTALSVFVFSMASNNNARADNCPSDRPCFNENYQKCHTVIFSFNGIGGWDFYNIRYSTAGGGETQAENRSGKFTVPNARPNSTYRIKVQGCYSRALQSSSCSPWVESSVTTEQDYGPDTCKSGHVWREAAPTDRVCVSTEARERAAAENALASARRQPDGGAAGPDTCRQGYVWREAFRGDHVCVTPQARTEVAKDNNFAADHHLRLCP
jgi:hypothetical protein